eukprot:9591593-Alexandrium_andersonii.AAC.1
MSGAEPDLPKALLEVLGCSGVAEHSVLQQGGAVRALRGGTEPQAQQEKAGREQQGSGADGVQQGRPAQCAEQLG